MLVSVLTFLGQQLIPGDPLLSIIGANQAESLQISDPEQLEAITVNTTIAIILGTVAALYRGTKIDLLATSWAVLRVVTPGFWVAILLIIMFSVNLGRLPAAGWVDPFDDPVKGIRHLILPVVSLGLFGSATEMRQTRSALLEMLRQDYVTTARSKGLRERVVIVRHALKNAMLPVHDGAERRRAGASPVPGGALICA